jgi:hypothetical protein
MQRLFFMSVILLIGFALFITTGAAQIAGAAPEPLSPKSPKNAQTPSVDKSAAVDGVVKDGEYAFAYDFPPFKVWVSRSKEIVRFAVTAKTSGWLALGVGSNRMHGAEIFMGTVKNGQAVFSEQVGRGQGHREADPAGRLAAQYSVKQNGDVMTMELAGPTAKIAPANVKELAIILAMSPNGSFSANHSLHRSVTLKLE